jgi:hypothetical protein
VLFAKRWKFVGSTVFEPIWQIVARADHSEGERLLSEPSRPSGQRQQLSVCAVSATARLVPRLNSLSHNTGNGTRFALFKEEQIVVAPLLHHWHYFLLLCSRLVAAVDEFERAALHPINLCDVCFIWVPRGSAVKAKPPKYTKLIPFDK